MKFILFVVASLLISPILWAQEGVTYNNSDSWQLGVTAGQFLPFGIVGVRDNYPWAGMFVSHPTRLSHLEYMLLTSNAKGVTYYNLSLSLRIDYDVYDIVSGFFSMGFSTHYYRRKSTRLQDFDFALVTGVHGGFGFTTHFVGPIHGRADLKFNLSPGKSVYFGVGLVYHFDSTDNEN